MVLSTRLHPRSQDSMGTAALAATIMNRGIHQNSVLIIYTVRDKLPRTAPGKA